MSKFSITGFSLLELLIALAVTGILASVAYPAYTDSMRKGRRAQGRVAIAEVLQQQERYMTQYNCYMAFTTDVNGAAAPVENSECGVTATTQVPFKPFAGDSVAAASHLLSATACAGSAVSPSLKECVRVEARPVLADPGAGTLWMASTGAKGCTPENGTTIGMETCWP
ncbi:MAG: prepilin-type N-terminal cleavage/methylation domain-containing protein [Alcaligenaceae bacterium]|nr:MAG: prepilin-type N-terminal cleavage/methylation domain-containing protein [Alcaligenaceae bacterium]